MSDDTRSRIAHLHRRAGFGIRPDELDGLVSGGYEAAVERLVASLRGPDAGGDAVALPTLDPASAVRPNDPADRQRRRQEGVALVAWWLRRMLATSTPLREKLTWFWHGHFATSIEKVRVPALMLQQNQLFRTKGAGRFADLVEAVAKDPAMVLWLDSATNKVGHPNENFARELMELFTLGIGQYSEADVKEAARCFTGWSLNRADGTFVFRPRLHDDGPKTLLGRTGDLSGEDAIAHITSQPACARFVAARLWSRLAWPVTIDEPLLAPLADSFARDLDIAGLVRGVLLHPMFTSPTARTGLVKQPVEYVVGTLRSLGLGIDDVAPAVSAVLPGLGQVPFTPPSVGGWPQNGAWLSTASSLARLRFAAAAAARADLAPIEATEPAKRADGLARLLSIDGWGPKTAAALASAAGDPRAALTVALVSPEHVLA